MPKITKKTRSTTNKVEPMSSGDKKILPFLKFLKENWGTLANLTITIIVGIFVAIFLQHNNQQFLAEQQVREQGFSVTQTAREQSFSATQQAMNAEFQRQLLSLQSDIQKKSELANLKFEVTCSIHYFPYKDCNDSIYVENLGPASANDIRIVVYIDNVTTPWIGLITDSNQFKISSENPALVFKTYTEKITPYFSYPVLQGDNSTTITIEKLPPDSKAMFTLFYKREAVEDKVYKTKLRLVYPTNKFSEWSKLDESIISTFAWRKFIIASFIGSVTCDNCAGDIKPIRLDVTAMRFWSPNQTNVIKNDVTTEVEYDIEIGFITKSPFQVEFMNLIDETKIVIKQDDNGNYYYSVPVP
jgi:hypothetical protein